MLDFDEIDRAARAATGADFTVPDTAEALSVLIAAYNAEGRLTPAGEAAKRAGLTRALTNRYRLEQAMRAHPEIAEEQIAGPVVIIGLPRSGTTKLHRMISADPGLQKLLLWQLLNPVPPVPDNRIDIAQGFEGAMRAHQPELYAAHPMAALEPDEDVFALEVTGRNYINCSTVPAPSYRAWLDTQSFSGVYQWLKNFLQVLQYFDHGSARPWVLKAPQHLGFLPFVFETFPNATIVHCHRQVPVSVASYAAMISAARRTACEITDAADVGQYALTFWSELMRRYLRDRAILESKHKFVDLSYQDIVARGMESIAGVYEEAGIALTPQARAAMRNWEQVNAQHKHGKHRYALSDAGLTEADVAVAFSQYAERFQRYF